MAQRISEHAVSSPDLQARPATKQMVVVSCYTRFDGLAHAPRGTEAKQAFYVFEMDPCDGQMVLQSVTKDHVMNPAFSRFHPTKNILYTCTESVAEVGEIHTWSMCPETGKIDRLASANAGGTSTCYITLDRDCRNMLVVNYWNATIGVFGLCPEHGHVRALRSLHDPNEGRRMRVSRERFIRHSENDAPAQRERQFDPHSHAVVLDPIFGQIAYVPDLGMDVIRQFRFDPEAGTLTPAGEIRSGPEGRTALGPRYIEFHPILSICYVVNELASEVSVFEFCTKAAENLMAGAVAPTLRLVQTVRTIPEGLCGSMNTCGRVCCHSTGNFLLVSNRGHDSITVFRVERQSSSPGLLSKTCEQHVRGCTPRHFQFDASGQWLITASQDSDKISVFWFNVATGKLKWTGHDYSVPSPNFVCCVQPRMATAEQAATTPHARLSRLPAALPAISVPAAGEGIQARLATSATRSKL